MNLTVKQILTLCDLCAIETLIPDNFDLNTEYVVEQDRDLGFIAYSFDYPEEGYVSLDE